MKLKWFIVAATGISSLIFISLMNGELAQAMQTPIQALFPNNLPASIITQSIVQIDAVVPNGTTDGMVTVETDDGTSNGSPFELGSSAVPDTSGIGTSWSTTFSGNITSDTVWNQNILITGDVTIPSGVTLTINPGVTVFFDANSDDQAAGEWTNKSEIRVSGTLTANGTEATPIYFTSNAATKNVGDWGGVVIRLNSTTSSLSHCLVQYAQNGVYVYTYLDGGDGSISVNVNNCTVQNNDNGIRLFIRPGIPSGGTILSTATLTNNLIRDNSYGIYIQPSTGYGTSTHNSTIQNNVVENNDIGISLRANSWWEGHVDNYAEVRNNTVKNNATYGIYIHAAGSTDSSGSDTDVQPTIEYNLIDNNGTNVYALLVPHGSDGVQILMPTIRYNTIRNGDYGIVIDDTEPFDTLDPTISHNVLYGFTTLAIDNRTARTITADQHYWGATETAWDAGPQPSDINGAINIADFFDTTSPPLLTRIEAATANSSDTVILYGANFGTQPPTPTPTPPAANNDDRDNDDDNGDDDDGDNDDNDDEIAIPPAPPSTLNFDCHPWFVTVSLLTIPGANVECLPSLGEPLPSPSTFDYLGHSTDITIKDAGSTPVTQFTTPLKICFRYGQPELDAVGGDPANFLIQTFHQDTWQALPTTPESSSNSSVLGQVCAPVNHLTLFALFVNDNTDLAENVQPIATLENAPVQTEQNLPIDNALLPTKYLPETGEHISVNLWSTPIHALLVSLVVLTIGLSFLIWHRKKKI